MTNTAKMTNTELQAALREAVEQSNRAFDLEDWNASRRWHLRAVMLLSVLEDRRRQ